MNCSTPGLPVHHQLSEFAQTHVHRVGDAIQPSHPLSSPSPPAPNPSQHQGLFQWVSCSHQVAKVLEFQLQHQSSNEHPGLISFRMDWLDLLAVQGTLKSLLQHHSSKASIFIYQNYINISHWTCSRCHLWLYMQTRNLYITQIPYVQGDSCSVICNSIILKTTQINIYKSLIWINCGRPTQKAYFSDV